MQVTTITNPRHIQGLLQECSQINGTLAFQDRDIVVPFKLVPDVKSPHRYVIRPAVPVSSPDETAVSFWLNNEYFRCVVSRLKSGDFALPKTIEQVNKRNHERIDAQDLSASPIFAVLKLPQLTLYSQLENLSADYLSVVVGEAEGLSAGGAKGQLSVYLDGSLIGIYQVSVAKIKRIAEARKRILLEVVSGERRPRRSVRQGDGSSLAAQLLWPDAHGIAIPMTIEEISGLGFSGKVIDRGALVLPVGTVFSEHASGARVRLAWRVGDRLGVSFDTAEPSARERLFEAVDSHILGANANSGRRQARSTLSLLTRSGLLKGERAQSFSAPEKMGLFLDRAKASRRWLCTRPGRHDFTSFVRISDSSWLIQELGSFSLQKGVGAKALLDSINYL